MLHHATGAYSEGVVVYGQEASGVVRRQPPSAFTPDDGGNRLDYLAHGPWALLPVGKGNNVEPINIGVIGMGRMGSAHACTMAQLDEVHVVAVADIEAERTRVIGEAVEARVFIDARDFLGQGGVATVMLATPHLQHAPLCGRDRGHTIRTVSFIL
jgi:threonine dehydrogenase-like Zn-dependent dehydrogenase